MEQDEKIKQLTNWIEQLIDEDPETKDTCDMCYYYNEEENECAADGRCPTVGELAKIFMREME